MTATAEATMTEYRGYYNGPAAVYRMRVVEWKKRRAVIEFRMRIDVRLGATKPRRRSVPVTDLTLDAASLDELTRAITAFPTFTAMLAAPHYRPTIRERDAAHILLANAYDRAQELRGDSRKAHRGSR